MLRLSAFRKNGRKDWKERKREKEWPRREKRFADSFVITGDNIYCSVDLGGFLQFWHSSFRDIFGGRRNVKRFDPLRARERFVQSDNRSRTRKKKQVTQTARYRNYFSSYDWCERNARNAPRPDLIRYLWRFDVIFDSTSARVPFLLAPRSSFASRSVDARTSVIETSRSRVMNRNYQRCVSITVSRICYDTFTTQSRDKIEEKKNL